MTALTQPQHKRVILKLSGEALMGDQGFGISPDMIRYVAEEVRSVIELGVQIAIVVGGGNIFRGIAASSYGMDRTSADHMGMLATVINSLALQDALEKQGHSDPGADAPSPCTRWRSRTSCGGPFGTLRKGGSLFLRPEPEPVFHHRHGRGPARRRRSTPRCC